MTSPIKLNFTLGMINSEKLLQKKVKLNISNFSMKVKLPNI